MTILIALPFGNVGFPQTWKMSRKPFFEKLDSIIKAYIPALAFQDKNTVVSNPHKIFTLTEFGTMAFWPK